MNGPIVSSWRKSARCSANNGCVEVAATDDEVLVRDAKIGDGSPILRFGRTAFAAFVHTVKADR